jgi:hypothetical protein
MSVFFLASVAPVVAPWWAATVERILIEWGRVLITVAVPTAAVVIRGMMSKREHEATTGKLDLLAEHAAVVVTQQNVVAQQLTAQLAENTAMTTQAADASKEAAAVANDVNNKIAATLGVVKEQQAQEQARQDEEKAPHNRRSGDHER